MKKAILAMLVLTGCSTMEDKAKWGMEGCKNLKMSVQEVKLGATAASSAFGKEHNGYAEVTCKP